MKHTDRPYRPINCSFHDVLLDRATRRKTVIVQYLSENAVRETAGIINDVLTKNGAEYMVLDNGQTIRLDFLKSVDGVKPTTFGCAS